MPGDSAKGFFGRVRPWQWIKHSVFTQYLWIWAMKVGSPPQAKTIWVIDAFAGAGEFTDTETGETAAGSPLQAALIAKKYNELPKKVAAGKELRLICIERDPDHCAALKERLKGFDFVEVLEGEFGEHADAIVAKIGTDRALVLLDPIGLKSIDAVTCKKLLHRNGKTDAFVNVQFAVVHRTRGQMLPDGEPDPDVQGSAANVRNIDAFFGTEAWRKIALSGMSLREQEAAWLQLYYDEVVGWRYSCKHHYPVKRTFDGKPKYYLVHIADHPDADWLINNLLASVESRLFVVSRERENPGSLTGFADEEDRVRVEDLKRALGKAAIELIGTQPSRAMQFGQLCLALRPEFFGKLKETDYSKAIKALIEKEQLVREKKGLHPALKPDEVISLPPV
ncbi:MAG: three-Cys-motif partner protein TcmP [Gaiellaceae bacterium MAG52_C11]|nr:three-Cys-motif partner protein TcmP [Candidatus Gaiellasilicea maunaloa]